MELVLEFSFFFASDPRELDDCQIDEKTKEILLGNIRRRLTPQAVKCRAGQELQQSFSFEQWSMASSELLDVEVACYGYEGIDAVKAALKEGLSASTEEMPVKVNWSNQCEILADDETSFRSI